MVVAKGRNGYFKVDSIKVWKIRGNGVHPSFKADHLPGVHAVSMVVQFGETWAKK